MTAEIIVVFGAASPALERRVDAALNYGKTRDATFVVTGGAVASAVIEATAMAARLRAAGIDESRIVEEPYARNTLDSVRRCLPLISTARRVVACSDDFHLARCRWLFRLAGVSTASVASHPQQRRAWTVVREIIAVPVDTLFWLLGL